MFDTPFVWALAVSAVTSLATAVLSARYRTRPGAKPLFVVALAALWWTVFYAAELVAESPAVTLAFARLQWVGVVVSPVAWLVFVLEYTGRDEYLTRPVLAGFAVVPTVTLVTALVSYDGLVRRNTHTVTFRGVSAVVGGYGPVFWLHLLFAWLLVAASAVLVVEYLVDRRTLYTRRALALLSAGAIPVATSFLVATGMLTVSHYTLTPIAFAGSSLVAVFAIVEFDLFGRAPVSPDLGASTAVEAVDDPVFVLDCERLVVDCNPAAASLVGADRETLLETPAEDVAPLDRVDDTGSRTTVTVEEGDETRYYDVQRATIDTGTDHVFGEVLTLRDVTDRREQQRRLDALTDVLRATIQEEMSVVKRVADDAETVSDVELLKERASVALDVSERAEELAAIVSPEDERPADIVPIINEEIDRARDRYSDVTFLLDASLGEWAYCSGLFEPVIRVALRHAAKRSRESDGDPVVGLSVGAGVDRLGDTVTVTVSDTGDGLSDHERAVLLEGAEPRPSDRDDLGRWLINWGVQQAGGDIDVGHGGDHTVLELTFPRTDG